MNPAGTKLVPLAYQSSRALEELMALVAVVEADGFSAAARATRGRKATLSRRVRDLEARLGVALLVRTTRSVRLTDEGRAYFAHASRSLAAARDAEAVVRAAKSAPSGLLRVTTSASLAPLLLAGVVNAYLAEHPDVSVHLDTSERRVDLAREGFDLAVRVGPLEESSLVARKLGVARGGYYASPRYLAARGEPARPDDLRAHDVVAAPKGEGPVEWPFVVDARPKRVSLRPRLLVTDVRLALRAAAAGGGVARAPLLLARPYLAKGRLVAVLEASTPPGLDVHAVFPPGGALVPKTRVFLDRLAAWFARQRGRV